MEQLRYTNLTFLSEITVAKARQMQDFPINFL
jgi:hypothetical protein